MSVLPEGCMPIMISMREMETLELKTGPSLKETILYKSLKTDVVLQDIQTVGFMNPFFAFRKEITVGKTDNLLLIADADEIYGENWYFTLTTQAYVTQLEVYIISGIQKKIIYLIIPLDFGKSSN